MVGSLEHAALAIDGVGHRIGAGSSRDVYLIDGIAYKVENVRGNYSQNIEESRIYDVFIEHCSELTNIKVPEMSFYSVGNALVVAAEFIDGIEMGECRRDPCDTHDTCVPYRVIEKISTFVSYNYDFAYGNIIFRNGIYYLVDLG